MHDTTRPDPAPALTVGGTNEAAAVAAVINTMPADAARLVAVEILLADPASLHDDVLESCLYILREKLTAA